MRSALGFGVLFSCALGSLAAQNQSTVSIPTIQALCIKVEPGKDAEYLRLMAEVAAPAAQVRANAGEFSNRLLMRSVYPAGSDAVCDYSVIYVYAGFPPDEKTILTQEAAYTKAHIAMKPTEFAAKSDAWTRLRKTELWNLTDTLGLPEVGNYLRENYVKMQAGSLAPWIRFEHDILKPVHRARLELGSLKGWGLMTLQMPTGSGLPYNAVTIDIYKNWAQVGVPTMYEEAFKKLGKKGDRETTLAEAAKLSGIFVRSELYEIVDVVTPAKLRTGLISPTTASAKR